MKDQKEKKNIEFIANNSEEALNMKKALEKKGYEVNHVYTGVATPIIIDGDNYIVGARNIRFDYGLF
ncbi:MAG: hypothetical protein ACP5NZ_04810 [Nanobdellota archaeon]